MCSTVRWMVLHTALITQDRLETTYSMLVVFSSSEGSFSFHITSSENTQAVLWAGLQLLVQSQDQNLI